MNDSTAGILNTTLTRDYVCAECRGVLVERVIKGIWKVLCPAGHDAPFVTRSSADRALSKKLEKAGIAVTPDFRGHSPLKRSAAALALFAPIKEKETYKRPEPIHIAPPPQPYTAMTQRRNNAMANNNPLERDKELTAFAAGELMDLPALLKVAELLVVDTAGSIRATKALLEEAVTDAQVNAAVDGKNAETRKLQMEQAVNGNGDVVRLRAQVDTLEGQRAAAEVDYNHLHRRWRSALSIADLQAAKIGYLATYRKEGK